MASDNIYPLSYKNELNSIYERREKATKIEIRDENTADTIRSNYNLAQGEQNERQTEKKTEKKTKRLMSVLTALKTIIDLDDGNFMAEWVLMDKQTKEKLIEIGREFEKFGIK